MYNIHFNLCLYPYLYRYLHPYVQGCIYKYIHFCLYWILSTNSPITPSMMSEKQLYLECIRNDYRPCTQHQTVGFKNGLGKHN